MRKQSTAVGFARRSSGEAARLWRGQVRLGQDMGGEERRIREMAAAQGSRLGTFPFLFSGVWVAFSQTHPGLQQDSVLTHLGRGSPWKHFPRGLEGGKLSSPGPAGEQVCGKDVRYLKTQRLSALHLGPGL